MEGAFAGQLPFLLMMFVVIFFFMILPQQRRAKKEKAFKKFTALSSKKNQGEADPESLPSIFQGYNDPDFDFSTYRGG